MKGPFPRYTEAELFDLIVQNGAEIERLESCFRKGHNVHTLQELGEISTQLDRLRTHTRALIVLFSHYKEPT